MKVLVLLDAANPYPLEWCNYLINANLCDIDTDVHKFWNPDEYDFDIIHVHWPEVLLSKINASSPHQYDKNIKSELFLLNEVLKRWKSKSKLICTVHNLKSHTENNSFSQEAFKSIIRYADNFIHLGNESLQACQKLFEPFVNKENSTIIPHNIYGFYPNEIKSAAARQKLGVSKNDFVILVFGELRTQEEVDFVLETFSKVKHKRKRLLIGRWKFKFHEGRLHRLKVQFMFWRKAITLGVINRFIRADEVQNFFNASDIVFCPRNSSLNSGIIPLSASFKKVVVGPNVGNIKEQLESADLKAYEAFNIVDAAKVIDDYSEQNLVVRGSEFSDFAQKEWSIKKVAEQHSKYYEEAMTGIRNTDGL